MGFFAPLFFAYTGVKVDLTALVWNRSRWWRSRPSQSPRSGSWSAAGSARGSAGSQAGKQRRSGAGLNARGAMELVIAAIGLSIGVLTEASYAIVVLIAVTTSAMAGPLIRSFMRRATIAEGSPDAEAEKILTV